jgi:hypothetical protein
MHYKYPEPGEDDLNFIGTPAACAATLVFQVQEHDIRCA